MVNGDAGWLERLLLILLDNAIKFTAPGGRVAIELRREGRKAVLSIRDNGVGIGEEEVGRIFEPFYRADAAQSRRTEGAGIGLALAKWIADQHDAAIAVSSVPGHGSTFTVSLAQAVDGHPEGAIKKS